LWAYGSPFLQEAVGIDAASTEPLRRAPKSPFQAVIRSPLYIGMGRNSIDERGFELVRRMRAAQQDLPPISLAAFKALVREQFLMLLIDQEAAVAAIPSMLPAEIDLRLKAIDVIKEVLTARRSELSTEDTHRMARIAGLFGIDRTAPQSPPRLALIG
jgi:hypothetical protein